MVEALNEIASALAKAQGEFPSIPKNRTTTVKTKTGGQYTYNYADLPSILDLTRKPLSKNGLSVSQSTVVKDGTMVLVTRLLHTSGQYIEATYPLPMNATPQETGSAITYARRYSLCPILGIAADEDDDGKTAEENDVRHDQPKQQPKAQPPVKASDPAWRGNVAKVEEVLPGKAWKIVGSKGEEFYTAKQEHAAVASSAAGKDMLIVILCHKTKKGNLECDSVDPSVKESAA